MDAATLASLLSWDDAVDALAGALALNPDVSASLPRTSAPVTHGELLMMPAESPGAIGFKLVGVAPGNPARGLPRIQAIYVLFDARTLAPRLLLDGAALTTLRTPAVSALAVRHLAAPDASRLVVFGSGPQAEAHVHAVASVRPILHVRVVARDAGRAAALVDRLRGGPAPAGALGSGSSGSAFSTSPLDTSPLDVAVGSAADVADADVVVCATSAREPLFDGARLAAHACIVAVGSHEPDARELDETVFARAARVVVEDRATALREAGDVIAAVAAGAVTAGALTDLADLPRLPPAGGLTVFKSVGVGWEDLAVAEAAARRYRPAMV